RWALALLRSGATGFVCGRPSDPPVKRITRIRNYSTGAGRGRTHHHDFTTQITARDRVDVWVGGSQTQVPTSKLRWGVDLGWVQYGDDQMVWRLPAGAYISMVRRGDEIGIFASHFAHPTR